MTQPFGLQAQGSDSSEEDEEMLSPDKLNYLFSTANHGNSSYYMTHSITCHYSDYTMAI